jgi:hypothetical protein
VYRLFALLVATACLCAAPVFAREISESDGEEHAASRNLATRSRIAGNLAAARPTPIDPVRSLHAEAYPIEGLAVFALSHGFALSRRMALYDLEGGASLRLDEGVRLTASYRMLGLDLGFDSDVEGADVELGLAAPFLGLVFDF